MSNSALPWCAKSEADTVRRPTTTAAAVMKLFLIAIAPFSKYPCGIIQEIDSPSDSIMARPSGDDSRPFWGKWSASLPTPEGGDMSKRMVNWIGGALLVSAFSILGPQIGRAQTALAKQSQSEQQAAAHAPDGWDRPVASSTSAQPGPAPRHDISGTWE